jgi:starch synthase (maltosyl-transferring)
MTAILADVKTKRVQKRGSVKRVRRVKSNRPAPAGFPSAIVIEEVNPQIDGGLFPVKCVVGDFVEVQATIYRDGHQILAACVKFKESHKNTWREVPLRSLENDKWAGVFVPTKNTRYFYTIEAWVDVTATWLDHIEKKARHDVAVKSEVAEGHRLLGEIKEKLSKKDRGLLEPWIKQLAASDGISEEVLRIIRDPKFLQVIKQVPHKSETSTSQNLQLVVDRKKAEYGTWYELFPRSQGPSPAKSGTFLDCVKRLPDIKSMGFDVIYLPPIHPIGSTNRKGKNNSLAADKDAPGSPWAIGNQEGGHKSIHPDLGTMKDFENFLAAARDFGIEIALDFAIQCSPDHPYVKSHPDWFYKLPDGSIRYAENPPKKYQDIYPINFNCADWKALWKELKSVVEFWIKKGITIFRVDNPHTKPLRFWEWLISEIQNDYPEVIFLAEAFTKPHKMKFLAKSGFTQSYTYFTWRNAKWELREYLNELATTETSHYFRPNFFTNTPDILHEFLQRGAPNSFKIRLVLAGTLSPSYGIYSGYELCENVPREPGSEEYLNSEKYEQKTRDWDQPGNIKDFIARFNHVRAKQPALKQFKNIKFYDTLNEQILAYGKWSADKSNVIVTVMNLDPFNVQEDLLHFPFWDFDLEFWHTYQMIDLLSGEKYDWRGEHQYIRLNPHHNPAHIFLLKK